MLCSHDAPSGRTAVAVFCVTAGNASLVTASSASSKFGPFVLFLSDLSYLIFVKCNVYPQR